MTVDRMIERWEDNFLKKSEFIVQDLLSKIYQESFINGKLPSQRELAKIYEVSRYTIQSVVKILEDIGIVEVRHGSGIYVRTGWVKNPLIFNSLTRTPYERITSKMLSLNRRLANKEEQRIFQIDTEAEVWEFERVRIVNYKIEQLEKSKMPVTLFPELTKEIIEHSIQDYVEKSGYRISHFITSYNSVSVGKELAEKLVCRKGTPAMEIINRSLLEDGKVYEYSEIISIDYAVTYIRPFDRDVHQTRID